MKLMLAAASPARGGRRSPTVGLQAGPRCTLSPAARKLAPVGFPGFSRSDPVDGVGAVKGGPGAGLERHERPAAVLHALDRVEQHAPIAGDAAVGRRQVLARPIL